MAKPIFGLLRCHRFKHEPNHLVVLLRGHKTAIMFDEEVDQKINISLKDLIERKLRLQSDDFEVYAIDSVGRRFKLAMDDYVQQVELYGREDCLSLNALPQQDLEINRRTPRTESFAHYTLSFEKISDRNESLMMYLVRIAVKKSQTSPENLTTSYQIFPSKYDAFKFARENAWPDFIETSIFELQHGQEFKILGDKVKLLKDVTNV